MDITDSMKNHFSSIKTFFKKIINVLITQLIGISIRISFIKHEILEKEKVNINKDDIIEEEGYVNI